MASEAEISFTVANHEAILVAGAGASAGSLNQAVELDLAELKDGDNRFELRSAHT